MKNAKKIQKNTMNGVRLTTFANLYIKRNRMRQKNFILKQKTPVQTGVFNSSGEPVFIG